jgi:hypothetical protein
MTGSNCFLEIRQRIHDKSHEYYSRLEVWHNVEQRRLFFGATDAILDASDAASSYGRAIVTDAGVNLLVCYGFLEVLYVQQDAVWNLCRALDLRWRPHDDTRLLRIRRLRNRLCRHPASADSGENKQRPSSGIILGREIHRDRFVGAIYYDDGFEKVTIDVNDMLSENQDALSIQLQKVEAEMDRVERAFRLEQSQKPFSTAFKGFGYLVQGLHCDLSDNGRAEQALSHVEMVREVVNELQKNLNGRGFPDAVDQREFARVFSGLEFIKYLIRQEPNQETQHKLDLIHRGLEVELRELEKRITELDDELRRPV